MHDDDSNNVGYKAWDNCAVIYQRHWYINVDDIFTPWQCTSSYGSRLYSNEYRFTKYTYTAHAHADAYPSHTHARTHAHAGWCLAAAADADGRWLLIIRRLFTITFPFFSFFVVPLIATKLPTLDDNLHTSPPTRITPFASPRIGLLNQLFPLGTFLAVTFYRRAPKCRRAAQVSLNA